MRFIPFPSIRPDSMRWGYRPNNSVSISPISKAIQVNTKPGALQTVSMTFTEFTTQEANALKAFFYSLEGGANYTKIWDFSKERPSGSLAGAPKVNGAGQAGYAIQIDDCQPGMSVLAGDALEVGGQLNWVASDASANASGDMIINFAFPLLVGPADNSLVVWDRPSLTCICVTDDFGYEVGSGGRIITADLNFMEVRI
jgi:hypothetical protein